MNTQTTNDLSTMPPMDDPSADPIMVILYHYLSWVLSDFEVNLSFQNPNLSREARTVLGKLYAGFIGKKLQPPGKTKTVELIIDNTMRTTQEIKNIQDRFRSEAEELLAYVKGYFVVSRIVWRSETIFQGLRNTSPLSPSGTEDLAKREQEVEMKKNEQLEYMKSLSALVFRMQDGQPVIRLAEEPQWEDVLSEAKRAALATYSLYPRIEANIEWLYNLQPTKDDKLPVQKRRPSDTHLAESSTGGGEDLQDSGPSHARSASN
ncbi:hypothetical protein F5Y19DRAFT_484204 [Xylariaceae sp. FL1651]|nr:hypothetical protein F5Y19DRAFT_484204 [Xylariaceae sp. FL1651]